MPALPCRRPLRLGKGPANGRLHPPATTTTISSSCICVRRRRSKEFPPLMTCTYTRRPLSASARRAASRTACVLPTPGGPAALLLFSKVEQRLDWIGIDGVWW